LTPASGRQDHTILPSAATSLVSVLLIAHKSFDQPCDPIARKTLPRPPHPVPYVRDDRELCVGRDGGSCRCDLGCSKTEIFLQMGLDWANHIDLFQQIPPCAHDDAIVMVRSPPFVRSRHASADAATLDD
jgi:hypothetical protein